MHPTDLDSMMSNPYVSRSLMSQAERAVGKAQLRGANALINLVANLLERCVVEVEVRETEPSKLKRLEQKYGIHNQDLEKSLEIYATAEKVRCDALDLLIELGVDRDDMDSDLLKGIRKLANKEDE